MKDRNLRSSIAKVRRDLRQFGLLPFTEREAPSLVSIVVGSPVTGSWWGHPAGQLIYQVGDVLEDDSDVLFLKLWHGKVTLVERQLWPALVRVGTARKTWQTEGLGAVPQRLLSLIDRYGEVRSDLMPRDFFPGVQGFRPALRELEGRLLVLTRSVHTASGAHALVAESWNSWGSRMGVPRFPDTVDAAQRAIAAAAGRLDPKAPPDKWLPWARATSKGSILAKRGA
jgi:hypothetical protein